MSEDTESQGQESKEESKKKQLEELIEDAEQTNNGETVPLRAIDTFGTVMEMNAEDFNTRFLEYAASHYQELGYTREQVSEWMAQFAQNRRFIQDPEYLKTTSKGKVQFVREGNYKGRFYPDTLDFFVEAVRNGLKLATFSKGGIELVEEFYQTPLPGHVREGGRKYSTYSDFMDGMYSTSSGG